MRKPQKSWTAAEKAKVRLMWNKGETAEAIGKTMGRTRGSVIGLINREGYTRAGETVGSWTAEEKAIVQEMWAKGNSGQAIADQLPGRSRNSVISIIAREGFIRPTKAPAGSVRCKPAHSVPLPPPLPNPEVSDPARAESEAA